MMLSQRQRNEAFAGGDTTFNEAAVEDFGDHTTALAGGKCRDVKMSLLALVLLHMT